MKRFILLFSLFFFPFFIEALTLKDKIVRATPGDFIVTEQNKHYSLLLLRSVANSTLVLEELSTSENQPSWDLWLKSGAPKHTSWILVEIDLQKNQLKSAYSFSKKNWIYPEESEYFLAKLLTLPLAQVPDDERRRIGPPPLAGGTDKRALWNPPLFIGGKKIEKPRYEVWKGKWPQDNTQLSGCGVELYFDAMRPSFPFPSWIEIKSPHYALKIRSIDSGRGLVSPFTTIPSYPKEERFR